MKVFKFGGASVRDAAAVRNVGNVLKAFPNESIMVVVSAMGKTTNKFEGVINAFWNNTSDLQEKITDLRKCHREICDDLFKNTHPIFLEIEQQFQQLELKISQEKSDNYDFEYDQIVSYGENLSTRIISAYLKEIELNSRWFDASKILATNAKHREGEVDWERTEIQCQKLNAYLLGKGNIAVSQGFLGGADDGNKTTLGREGSDYSAAIFAYCLDAESVTIWKDVPGLLNADPKYFDETTKIEKISFREAIELSYYGASVIHPKTIKPLQNKNIPLYIKSFIEPKGEGTVIQSSIESDHLVPSYIFKMDQVLLSISPRDFSFINENNLSRIFDVFSTYGIKINLMQNSAINFSACFDLTNKLDALIDDLSKDFKTLHNKGLELITIRHQNKDIVAKLTDNRPVLLTQETRHTIRILIE